MKSLMIDENPMDELFLTRPVNTVHEPYLRGIRPFVNTIEKPLPNPALSPIVKYLSNFLLTGLER